MKTGIFSPRVLLASILSALLVLAVAGYGQHATPPSGPKEGPVEMPRNPGPHSIILDTTTNGQTVYPDPGGNNPTGDGRTLDITLPALDSDYCYPRDSHQYRSVPRTIGQDTPPSGQVPTNGHDVLVIRMTPPLPGTSAGDLVKQTPLVIVQTGQTPLPTPMPTKRPTVILNLRDYLPQPAGGQPASVSIKPDP